MLKYIVYSILQVSKKAKNLFVELSSKLKASLIQCNKLIIIKEKTLVIILIKNILKPLICMYIPITLFPQNIVP